MTVIGCDDDSGSGGGGGGNTGDTTPDNNTPGGGSTMTWTAVNRPFGTGNIYAIAYGGGTFVAVGESGKMAYSSDGVTWSAVGTSPFVTSFGSTYYITAIAYGNGTFVAMRGWVRAYSTGEIATSTDGGVTWTPIDVDSIFGTYSPIYAIAYGNNTFVAGSQSPPLSSIQEHTSMWTSTNGTIWTSVTVNYTINAIAHNGGTGAASRFVAVCNSGKMMYSSDNGVTWTAVTDSTFGATDIRAIAWGGGKFVAGGGYKMATSTDGVTWTTVNVITLGTPDIKAIAYGNGTFVAGALGGKMLYSTGN